MHPLGSTIKAAVPVQECSSLLGPVSDTGTGSSKDQPLTGWTECPPFKCRRDTGLTQDPNPRFAGHYQLAVAYNPLTLRDDVFKTRDGVARRRFLLEQLAKLFQCHMTMGLMSSDAQCSRV